MLANGYVNKDYCRRWWPWFMSYARNRSRTSNDAPYFARFCSVESATSFEYVAHLLNEVGDSLNY